MKYPLMNNNIDKNDLNVLVDFLKTNPRVTNGNKVKQFEQDWSNWLQSPYSCMVNSGTSANLTTMHALKQITDKKKIILPPLTWVSDIHAVIDAGFEPVFVDINQHTLALDTNKVIEAIDEDTAAVFITHILGLNGLTNKLLSTLKTKKIHLIEDCCESHGATHGEHKVGTFGLASNFSFYFAHHMTTIEGGIISTPDENFLNLCKMVRSHGMLRENPNLSYRQSIEAEFPDLHPEFIFASKGYNFRPTEINAVIGIEQLKRIDQNIKKRNENFLRFLDLLPSKYFKDYSTDGMSNYALLVLTNDNDPDFMKQICQNLLSNGIEFRRGMSGGGNQLRQPYLKKKTIYCHEDFPLTEKIHNYGMYIGNYPELKFENIEYIAKCLAI